MKRSGQVKEAVYLAGAQQLQLRAADVVGRPMAPPRKHPEYQQVQPHCVDHYKDAGSPAYHSLSSFMAQAAGPSAFGLSLAAALHVTDACSARAQLK